MKLRRDNGSAKGLALLTEKTSRSRYGESFRTLRTNIGFSLIDRECGSLLVTSAGAGEGKTNTVVNLAFTMAQAGKRVLMLDGDLRRPMLSRAFATDRSTGLTSVVSGLFSTAIEEGELGRMGLGDLFRLIRFGRKTGRLELSGGGETVEIFFLDGGPADINWITRPADRMLLAVLVNNGVLAEEQAEQVRRRRRETGRRTGVVLTGMGLLAESELSGTLGMHVMEALHQARQIQQGRFSFTGMYAEEIDTGLSGLVNLERIFQEVTMAGEELPYLEQGIRSTVVELDNGCFLLPTGPVPPNPSEMLGSGRVSFLFQHLQRMFDVVIVDSPPLLPASDALLIAPQVDGVVLVVKAGSLSREMIAKTTDQLRNSQANLLGVVLNQVDTKREGYYKYYYKYYSKYYGEKQ